MTTNAPVTTPASLSPLRLLAKTVGLFLLANLLFAAADPMPLLGRLSVYNLLFPGRPRFPFGERPQDSYNISLNNVEAMFSAHEIAGAPKAADEYRIIAIGDSSIWGYLLRPDETIAARTAACLPAGKHARVFNLGYPENSLLKDVVVLETAIRYQPDAILWFTTLEAFPEENQMVPVLAGDPAKIRSAAPEWTAANLAGSQDDLANSLWKRSIIGRRRDLADLARLQMYGVMWAATGLDQYYPAVYEAPASDLESDPGFHGQMPPALDPSSLAWDLLAEGRRIADRVPIFLINEPVFISRGNHSAVRYNALYPRWAYDAYRTELRARAAELGWAYLDAWDLIPSGQFTNSSLHFNPAGETIFADRICRLLESQSLPPA